MDCRVISAFTRVFRRAMPGNDAACACVLDQSRRRITATATQSLAARHVQARIEESHRRLADLRMDAAAVDAGRVDAGLWEFIPAGLAALVDEDVVVDAAGDDVKLRALGVSGGKSAILGGWRLGIGLADPAIRRHPERLPS